MGYPKTEPAGPTSVGLRSGRAVEPAARLPGRQLHVNRMFVFGFDANCHEIQSEQDPRRDRPGLEGLRGDDFHAGLRIRNRPGTRLCRPSRKCVKRAENVAEAVVRT